MPIGRAPTREAALRICQVLIEAGMGTVEVTFTVPRAPEVTARLRDSHRHTLVGAGTVLDASAARAAVDAGAEFLVSVVAPPDVMAAGREHGVPIIPGAFTPAEIMAALAQGRIVHAPDRGVLHRAGRGGRWAHKKEGVHQAKTRTERRF